MYYSVLLLPNGTELKGGEAGSTLKALTLHTAVNAGQEFAIGSAFSDYIEAEIWADPGGSLQITAGDALTYYRQDDAGNRTKVGVFYAEKPTRTKRNSYKVTAYDTMSKLDADFSGWLRPIRHSSPKLSGSWCSWPASGQGLRWPAAACPSMAATACRRSTRTT